MSDLDRVGNIRAIQHMDGDGLLLSGRSGVQDVRAQLNEEQAGLPGRWPPLSDLGKASNLL
jgi:hypothetical protein